mgnify:CR=1 FL=1
MLSLVVFFLLFFCVFYFFFNDTATTEIYTLSLHDALPIYMLIQSMGILFTVSTLALIFSLHGNELLTSELGVWSSVSVVPAIFGMVIGQRIRQGLSERAFRKLFFFFIFTIGAYIEIGRAHV